VSHLSYVSKRSAQKPYLGYMRQLDRYVVTAAVAALQPQIKNSLYFAAYATQSVCSCVCVCVCVCVLYLPALFTSVVLAMTCSKGKSIPDTLISDFMIKQTLSTPDSPKQCMLHMSRYIHEEGGERQQFLFTKFLEAKNCKNATCPWSRSVHKARSQGAWSKRRGARGLSSSHSLSPSVRYLKGIK
jgi:hypothetical protein